MGENPAMSDPDVDHAREAMAALDHSSCRTSSSPRRRISPTSCCRRPRGRRRSAPSPTPIAWCSSDARRSSRPATRERTSGCSSSSAGAWASTGTTRIRATCSTRCARAWTRSPASRGNGSKRESSVTYPCVKEGDPGDPVVFIDNFPTPTGRAQVRAGRSHLRRRASGRRVPDGAHHRPAARTLAHRVDDAPRVEPRLHRAGAGGVGASARSRRARRRARRHADDRVAARQISLYARADDGMPRGAVFVPFCYYEAAANMLTNPVLDPFGKIPEFKYCAVKVTAGGDDARAHELRRRRDSRGSDGSARQ